MPKKKTEPKTIAPLLDDDVAGHAFFEDKPRVKVFVRKSGPDGIQQSTRRYGLAPKTPKVA